MAAGPALQLSEMITEARRHAQDTDTTNPGLSDAEYTARINQHYLTYFRMIEPRVSWVSATFSDLTMVGGTRAMAINTTKVPRIDEVIGLFDEGTDIVGLTATRGQPLQYQDIKEMLAESTLLGVETIDVSQRGAPRRYAVLHAAANPDANASRGAITIYLDRYLQEAVLKRYYSIMVRQSPRALRSTAYTVAGCSAAGATVLLSTTGNFLTQAIPVNTGDLVTGHANLAANVYVSALTNGAGVVTGTDLLLSSASSGAFGSTTLTFTPNNESPDVTPAGAYIIATMAGYDAARLLMRDQAFTDGVLKFISDEIQERMMVGRKERDPVVQGGKARV